MREPSVVSNCTHAAWGTNPRLIEKSFALPVIGPIVTALPQALTMLAPCSMSAGTSPAAMAT